MLWIVLFVFLHHFSIPHTPNPLFHTISFLSSLTHSLISFKSYTVSCITNLDNSFHPFHFPCSSFHTHYQSAFRMLCNTIYASFSTKKCTLPHILSQLKLCYRFELFLHVPSYTLKKTSWNKQSFPAFFNLYSSS